MTRLSGWKDCFRARGEDQLIRSSGPSRRAKNGSRDGGGHKYPPTGGHADEARATALNGGSSRASEPRLTQSCARAGHETKHIALECALKCLHTGLECVQEKKCEM